MKSVPSATPGSVGRSGKLWYFVLRNGMQEGPVTREQLMRSGVTTDWVVWRDGLSGWVRAAEVPELAPLIAADAREPIVAAPPVGADAVTPVPSLAGTYAASAVHRAGRVLGSFARVDFKREVWPLDGPAAKAMASDPAFWCVSLLAALPLLFCSFGEADQTLAAFSLFFSGVWALIFCYVIQGERVGWGWRIGCLMVTGTLGIGLCKLLYQVLPTWYTQLPASPTFWVRVTGYVAQVGLLEELIKILPVTLVAVLLRHRLLRVDVVLLGVFSGLGFAAFENLHYFHGQLNQAVSGAIDAMAAVNGTNVTGDMAARSLADAAYWTMLMPLVRSLASPFGHAVWSAMFAHFVAAAVRPEAEGRRVALIACGWALAALMHGLYNALQDVQIGLSAAVGVLSFMLLRLYLAGIAEHIGTSSTSVADPQPPEVAVG